jgi:dephospho-CoA kinase
MFRELGVPVIDADAMARRIVEPGRKAWKAIRYFKIIAIRSETLFFQG